MKWFLICTLFPFWCTIVETLDLGNAGLTSYSVIPNGANYSGWGEHGDPSGNLQILGSGLPATVGSHDVRFAGALEFVIETVGEDLFRPYVALSGVYTEFPDDLVITTDNPNLPLIDANSHTWTVIPGEGGTLFWAANDERISDAETFQDNVDYSGRVLSGIWRGKGRTIDGVNFSVIE